jgi:MGT family glycosyltransferase
MRALFTCHAAFGHFHSLIPVAAALTAAGHEVAFCSSPSFRAEVEPWGFSYFGIGPEAQEIRADLPEQPPPGPDSARWTQRYFFAGASVQRRYADLLALAGDWQPQVLVRENSEYAGCLVAETLGLPHASVATGAWSALDSRSKEPDLAEPLAERRAEVGLPPDPAMEMMFRYLHLCFMHPRFDGPDAVFPPTAHFLRHDNPQRSDETLPSWIDGLDDRPLVLASLGTVARANQMPGLLEAILAGMGGGDVNLILASGRGHDPARFGPQPSHVHIEPYVPQRLLLSRCDLFISHGGFNGVKEALSLGVPLVVIPIHGDQFYCAERCADLGVARVIDPDNRTPESIARAAATVLGDPRYRTSAAEFQAEMAAMPGPERAVELLEQLATSCQPLIARA